MRYYKKILVWENKRRTLILYELRELVIEYFNNSHVKFGLDERVEEQKAQAARMKINRMMDEVHDIIINSSINPSINWSPPPAIGGYIKNIDIIQNIFNLNRLEIGGTKVLDYIDRSIGIYERNHSAAVIRTINPFFYIGWLVEFIVELPFLAIAKLGLDRKKAESSMLGRIIKGILYLITVIAALLTILQLLDILEPVKIFFQEFLK